MRVAVVPDGSGDASFVATIRITDPLDAVARRHPLRWSVSTLAERVDADVIVLQRAPFRSVEELERAAEHIADAKRRGASLLWEIDDAIFCDELPELIRSSTIDEVDDDAVAVVRAHRRLLPLADAFTCPTDPLAEELRRVMPDARGSVVPVALDFAHGRWQGTATPRERVTIGWCGGSRVGADLKIFLPVLERVFQKHPRLRFLYAGPAKYAPLFGAFSRVEIADWVSYDDYPQLLSRFDVALLPMVEHAYNRCKSGLKVIDYAAAGVPSICSRTTPFLSVADDVAAFAGTSDEWLEALDRVMEQPADENARLRERTRARHDVSTVVDLWWEALNSHAR